MAKGLLIHNPDAGATDAALVPKLVEALGEVETLAFADCGNPKNVGARARSLGCDWVAVVGGDGTVECVAAALIGENLPLGIIPAGTYNNFARSLNLPQDPFEACAVIKAGHTKPIDAGRANGQPFFECLGSGLDAALYPVGEDIKSGHYGRLADFFRQTRAFQPQQFSLALDRPLPDALTHGSTNESLSLLRRVSRMTSSELTLTALMLTVSNGPYFGMNFGIAPNERLDDGFLTVTVFSHYSKYQLWWHFVSIAFGRRSYRPRTLTFRVRALRVGGPRHLPVHLDGTLQETGWPLEITCQPAVLSVFRPR